MKNSEENKQLTFWDWSPEDCPKQETGDFDPEFDLSLYMNPPEEGLVMEEANGTSENA